MKCVGCWSVTLLYLQADCLVETQVNVYERFLSGMMAKDKKEEEKAELPDEDQQDDTGTFQMLFSVLLC